MTGVISFAGSSGFTSSVTAFSTAAVFLVFLGASAGASSSFFVPAASVVFRSLCLQSFL
jgi:hypothetical protein